MIPCVVLVGLAGVAIYDLLTNVTRLFQEYHERAVGASSWYDLRSAGKLFAQAVLGGLLDVLSIFVGATALARLRALRVAGKLTVGTWLALVEEQAQALRVRLRGGIKKLSQLVEEQQQRQGVGEGKGKVVPVVRRLPKYRTRPPFKRNPKHSKAEFERQVKAQQDGLNEMTVEEYLKNSDKYKNKGRTGDLAKQQAREKALVDKQRELRRQGKNPQEAKAEADKWMAEQDALHNPDQIAGGNPDHIGGMGDRGVNRSIGSQWEKKGRAKSMDEYIREKARNMTPEERKTTKLDIELDH